MNRTIKVIKNNSASIIVLMVAAVAMGVLHLDSLRNAGFRAAYEQFISETASPFKGIGEKSSSHIKDADSPDLASLQDYFMTMDPNSKRVTAERLVSAQRELKAIQNRKNGSAGFQLQWSSTDSDMGGRTRAIMWDPRIENKVWAGSVTGGLWYNNDITSALSPWQPVNDMWDNLVISSIAYDPVNPLIMYVGTGEAQTALITYRESSGRGVGIWKTTDGGQHWSLLPSTSAFSYVTSILVRNEAGIGVVYAGVVSGYYQGNQVSMPSDGLYRSTNGGITWQQVLPAITGSNVPYAPDNITIGADGRLFVGTMQNMQGNGGSVVLFSDNGTAGTWTKFEDVASLIKTGKTYPLPGRVVIATSKSDANVVYAAFSGGYRSQSTQPVYKGLYIYKSSNKGVSWSPVSLPGGSPEWANLAWHAMTIGVDPNNPNVVWAGGLDQWRSVNGGASWTHYSDWSLMYSNGGNLYIHADQHAVVYKPGSSSVLAFGTDGGVFYCNNGNATEPIFSERNKKFNTLQFYSGALHPVAGQDKFIGGLQDNGSLLYQGTPLTIKSMISGGDGSYCFWDKDNPLIYLTSVYYNWYYVFNSGTKIEETGWYRSGIFINPADYYSEQNTIYANAIDFWGGRTDSLLVISKVASGSDVKFISSGTGSKSYFSHVKISPHSKGTYPTLFLGTVAGRLYKAKPTATSIESTEIGSPSFPVGNISCVAVGGSEDTLLVAFSNYGVSSLWQTYNGGKLWKEVENNLPDMPVRWVIYHPQNSKQALIATELGVWSSTNLGDAQVVWEPQNSGLANVRVDMLTLRSSDNTVLAATHGRGLFTTKYMLDVKTATDSMEPKLNPFEIYVSQTGLELRSALRQESTFGIYTMSGSKILTGEIGGSESYKTINSGRFAPGVYLVKIQSGKFRLVKKVVL